ALRYCMPTLSSRVRRKPGRPDRAAGRITMKVTLACAVAFASALAWLAEPLAAASPAVAAPDGAAGAAALPATRITVPGHGGDRVYDGVGAILGGGGNARYLLDYPRRQRSQIMDYLFKPGYGAALQILK